MRKFAVLALAVCAATSFAQYQVDDGTPEGSIGLTSGGQFVWANQFTATAGNTLITSVEISWWRNGATGGVMSPNGTPIVVNLWSDPNGDGNPADAVVMSTLNSTITNSDLPGFVSYDIPDVALSVGQNFFVGATITHAAGEFPASWDSTTPQGKSWISLGGTLGASGSTFNLVDLTANGLNGNWMVRATSAVPEPASMAALGIGALALIRRRKAKRS